LLLRRAYELLPWSVSGWIDAKRVDQIARPSTRGAPIYAAYAPCWSRRRAATGFHSPRAFWRRSTAGGLTAGRGAARSREPPATVAILGMSDNHNQRRRDLPGRGPAALGHRTTRSLILLRRPSRRAPITLYRRSVRVSTWDSSPSRSQYAKASTTTSCRRPLTMVRDGPSYPAPLTLRHRMPYPSSGYGCVGALPAGPLLLGARALVPVPPCLRSAGRRRAGSRSPTARRGGGFAHVAAASSVAFWELEAGTTIGDRPNGYLFPSVREVLALDSVRFCKKQGFPDVVVPYADRPLPCPFSGARVAELPDQVYTSLRNGCRFRGTLFLSTGIGFADERDGLLSFTSPRAGRFGAAGLFVYLVGLCRAVYRDAIAQNHRGRGQQARPSAGGAAHANAPFVLITRVGQA